MDAFLSFIPSGTFVQNVIPIKNIALPKMNSKGPEKAFLVKIKKKMLRQTLRIL